MRLQDLLSSPDRLFCPVPVAEVVNVVRGAYLVCKAVDIVYRREDIVDYDMVRDKVVVQRLRY